MSALETAGWAVLAAYASGVVLGLHHFYELSKPVPFEGMELTDKQRADIAEYRKIAAHAPPGGMAVFHVCVSLCWPLFLIPRGK